MSNGPGQVSREAVRRLARDVRALSGDTLAEHGVYYAHSDTSILEGEALIVGPDDTPYAWGMYAFSFLFPTDYPHSPPKVEFLTRDQQGNMRFNPNLYRNGTVCLSILNTWQGPQWTGCQTISSILLSIRTAVLNAEPALNEPGVTRSHRDFGAYHRLLSFKNLETAVFDTRSGRTGPAHPVLKAKVRELYRACLPKVMSLIQDAADHPGGRESVRTGLYDIRGRIDYAALARRARESSPGGSDEPCPAPI